MDNREVFKNLTANLSALFMNNPEPNKASIRKIIDDLNKLNYRLPTVQNKADAILLIRNCCQYVAHNDNILVPACCRLITQLMNLQKIATDWRTYNDLMNWCLKILAFPEKREFETVEVFILLDALARKSNPLITQLIYTAIQPDSLLFKIIEETDNPAVRRYGLQFLEACTIIDENESDENIEQMKKLMERCIEIFQANLLELKKFDEASDLKIKIICFRGLDNIIRKFDGIGDMGKVLGIIKYYMLLGVRNSECSEIKSVMPASLSIPEVKSYSVREKKGGKVTKLRRHKVSKQLENHPTEDWMQSHSIEENTITTPLAQIVTSDSDVSDSGIPKAVNLPRLQSRVRQMSLSLLYSVAKKLEKAMLTYGTSFIPEYSGSGKLFLTTCVLEDPSIECRTAALNVLLYMLASSKLCWLQADPCGKSTSFTPFSATLGSMLVSLHECFNLASKDKITSVLAEVLKCYSALIEATPYHRLDPGLVTKIIHSVHPLLQHKDPTVKTRALIVFGCILASEPVVEETKNIILSTNLDENNSNTKKDENTNEKNSTDNEINNVEKLPSILKECLNNLQTTNIDNVSEHVPLPLKIESVKTIGCMCRNYFKCLVYPYLAHIGKAMCDCLSDKNCDLKLHTGEAIDCIGQSMAQFLEESENSNDDMEGPGVNFWLNLLNGPLTTLLDSTVDVSLRAVACSCMGSIGSRIFENLPVDKHYLCVTYILASCRDEEPSLRSAAIRAIGNFCRYPTLREDIGFIHDVGEVIYRTINDENTDVRFKTSFALGNFSDVLILNSTNENVDAFSSLLMVKLLEKCVVVLPKCKDKTKANFVRAMGNLLHLIDREIFEKAAAKIIIESSVQGLIKAASTTSNMKVRWNACYALSLLLKNEAIHLENPKWLESIFITLNSLVIDFSNFKVRTIAALALSSPSKRMYYGTHYHSTWHSLLKSLENSQHIDDYAEYQHKSRLIEQVCLSLAHLMSLAELEDLPIMKEKLNSYLDLCKTEMNRMYEILLPEKSNIIFSAAEHLKSFTASNVNAETKEALTILQDIIVQSF